MWKHWQKRCHTCDNIKLLVFIMICKCFLRFHDLQCVVETSGNFLVIVNTAFQLKNINFYKNFACFGSIRWYSAINAKMIDYNNFISSIKTKLFVSISIFWWFLLRLYLSFVRTTLYNITGKLHSQRRTRDTIHIVHFRPFRVFQSSISLNEY